MNNEATLWIELIGCQCCERKLEYLPRTSLSCSPWARSDRHGVYAGQICDGCWKNHSLNFWEFDAADAGEHLESEQ